jgi:hypothetical protein
VNVENRFALGDVRQAHGNLAVEATWTQQGAVQNVGAICRGHDDDARRLIKAVHFSQNLVQGLLALVVTAADASAALATNAVQFVNEDDGRRGLPGVIKQRTHPRGSDADEHLHKLGG